MNIGKNTNKNDDSKTPLQAQLVFVSTAELQPVQEEPASSVDTFTEPDPIAVQPDIQQQSQETPQTPDHPAEITAQEQVAPDVPITETQIITGTSTEKRYPVSSRDIARQHLTNIQQQLQSDLVQQSTREYRRQLTSPTIKKPTEQPFMTEEEKLIESVKVNVDCSSTVNKSLAFMSGMTGGTINCSKGPSLAPYIQKRINKLPEGYQSAENNNRTDNP